MTTTSSRWHPLRRAAGQAPSAPVDPSPARVRRHEVVLYSVLGVIALVAGTLGIVTTLG